MATILVVDDDEQMRSMLRQWAKQAGHQVLEAANGAAGIAAFEKNSPDLIITDIFMPESEGLGMIREVRKRHGNVKIIAMSSGSDTVPTAYALSETIKKIGGYDLILTGEETTDASTGHVGPGIAGHLDLPQVTYVSEVQIEDGTLRARRTAEDGTEWWQTKMPSLCTVNFGCNRPRSPSLTGKIRVKRGGVIVHWSCADVGIDPKKVGLLNSPTIVAKVDTIRLPARAGQIFTGEPKDAVQALLEALIRDRVIPR